MNLNLGTPGVEKFDAGKARKEVVDFIDGMRKDFGRFDEKVLERALRIALADAGLKAEYFTRNNVPKERQEEDMEAQKETVVAEKGFVGHFLRKAAEKIAGLPATPTPTAEQKKAQVNKEHVTRLDGALRGNFVTKNKFGAVSPLTLVKLLDTTKDTIDVAIKRSLRSFFAKTLLTHATLGPRLQGYAVRANGFKDIDALQKVIVKTLHQSVITETDPVAAFTALHGAPGNALHTMKTRLNTAAPGSGDTAMTEIEGLLRVFITPDPARDNNSPYQSSVLKKLKKAVNESGRSHDEPVTPAVGGAHPTGAGGAVFPSGTTRIEKGGLKKPPTLADIHGPDLSATPELQEVRDMFAGFTTHYSPRATGLALQLALAKEGGVSAGDAKRIATISEQLMRSGSTDFSQLKKSDLGVLGTARAFADEYLEKAEDQSVTDFLGSVRSPKMHPDTFQGTNEQEVRRVIRQVHDDFYTVYTGGATPAITSPNDVAGLLGGYQVTPPRGATGAAVTTHRDVEIRKVANAIWNFVSIDRNATTGVIARNNSKQDTAIEKLLEKQLSGSSSTESASSAPSSADILNMVGSFRKVRSVKV